MTTRANLGFVLASLLLATPALAERAEVSPSQVEWAQDYAGPAAQKAARSSTPVLSADALRATEQAVETYARLAGVGGWPMVSGLEGLKIGARGPGVADLRRRLVLEGDLDRADGEGTVYDSYVKEAVRRFQVRHGLTGSGAMGAATAQAMNVPASVRLAQLRINVQRLRSYQGDLGRRHVVVNLPAALVETVEEGTVVSRHAAGVGKVDRQSPIMNARATEVNLNPYWHVPASIIRKDLIPKMQKDPNYLTDNKIHAYDGEREISPAQINWLSDEATRYRFRQEPGATVNSMGFVRINIPNPEGVYMHDTPSKGVFGDDFRFISSGCVRVQNVRGYIEWLLRETPGWDGERIAQAIASGERIDAKLAQPVPVYWTYITAWSQPDGTVQFRDDIYGKDTNSTAYQAQIPAGSPQAAPAGGRPPVAAMPAQPASGATKVPPVVFIPLARPRPEPVAEALPPRDVGRADVPGPDGDDDPEQ